VPVHQERWPLFSAATHRFLFSLPPLLSGAWFSPTTAVTPAPMNVVFGTVRTDALFCRLLVLAVHLAPSCVSDKCMRPSVVFARAHGRLPVSSREHRRIRPPALLAVLCSCRTAHPLIALARELRIRPRSFSWPSPASLIARIILQLIFKYAKYVKILL